MQHYIRSMNIIHLMHTFTHMFINDNVHDNVAHIVVYDLSIRKSRRRFAWAVVSVSSRILCGRVPNVKDVLKTTLAHNPHITFPAKKRTSTFGICSLHSKKKNVSTKICKVSPKTIELFFSAVFVKISYLAKVFCIPSSAEIQIRTVLELIFKSDFL